MLNFQQLQTMAQQLTQLDLDNMAGESPTSGATSGGVQTDLGGQVNWAYRIIARKCCLAAQTPLYLVEGQFIYNLRDVTTPQVGAKIIRPVLVYITAGGQTTPLYDANTRDYGLWSYDELARLVPSWQTDTQSGPPTKAVFYNYDQLLLNPTPDAATGAASGHSVFGQYLPNDMANDTDIPDLPEEIHEAVAWLAAQLAATPVATEQEAWTRLQKYSDYWTQIIQDVADQNERTFQAFGASKGYYFDELMVS